MKEGEVERVVQYELGNNSLIIYEHAAVTIVEALVTDG